MKSDLRDICVHLANRPGALADFGEALGRAGVSLEGGGVFARGSTGTAHFLVDRADTAGAALAEIGVPVISVSEVVMVQLDQETPGQLGKLARLMGDASVNIDVQYSDHGHNLVLVVDPESLSAARAVAAAWAASRSGGR